METRIGWIGLGKMGMPMAGNLLRAGYPLYIYARNNTVNKAMTERGAIKSESPSALLNLVDVLILMVPDDKAVDRIFLSPAGIFHGQLEGKVIINMSTVSPGINRKMAALCMARGASYLDAPVSGSIKQAEEAKLVIMAGGERSVYENLKPIFNVLGSSSKHFGSLGSGNVAKLAINVLLGIQAQGLSEVINFGESNGISAASIIEVINDGVLGNTFLRLKGEQIIAQNYQPAFALNQIAKDLRQVR